MSNHIRNWLGQHPYARWLYPVCIIITAILFVVALASDSSFVWVYTGIFVTLLLALRPTSALHSLTMESNAFCKTVCNVVVAAVTIAACVLPMSNLSLWNGEDPGHRNQYELMAEAILDGRINIEYGDEEGLLQLENPYDPDERKEAGVKFHWDHAYYDGQYYMYFGIVPVLLVFLPHRILTGTPLTTYHATQLFVALAISGVFVLFHLLSKLFFKKLSYSAYLALSVAFSVMSVWYSVAEPALYCTAITGAIALEIWSLYFFVRAVWSEQQENRQILFAGVGAMLGALVFGCRPSVALANVLVIPMLVVFLRQRKFTLKLLGKLALAALPYVVVGIALMIYNYVRFDNPFEFGQAYQLTVADQTEYSVSLDFATIVRLFNETLNNFFRFKNATAEFPYMRTSSVFCNFPVLLLCFGIFNSAVFKGMKREKLLLTVGVLFLAAIIITGIDILWTPYLLERYRMDIYFLMGIGCFVVLGFWHDSCTEKQRSYMNFAITALSLITVISSFLLCVNTIGVYYSEEVEAIAEALRLI